MFDISALDDLHPVPVQRVMCPLCGKVVSKVVDVIGAGWVCRTSESNAGEQSVYPVNDLQLMLAFSLHSPIIFP